MNSGIMSMIERSAGGVQTLRDNITRVIAFLILQDKRDEPNRVLGSEVGLARHFKVSRTVLREAVKVLQGKGMIEVRPKTGIHIRPRSAWSLLDADLISWQSAMGLDEQFVRNLTKLRLILEPAAAQAAAIDGTDEEIRAIYGWQMKKEVDPDNMEACVGCGPGISPRDRRGHAQRSVDSRDSECVERDPRIHSVPESQGVADVRVSTAPRSGGSDSQAGPAGGARGHVQAGETGGTGFVRAAEGTGGADIGGGADPAADDDQAWRRGEVAERRGCSRLSLHGLRDLCLVLWGRTPWSAADPLVGLSRVIADSHQADQGVGRRPGGPAPQNRVQLKM